MDTKKTIRKILFISHVAGDRSGMLTLLIAAIGKQKKELCKGYEITIKMEKADKFFLDKEGDWQIVEGIAKGDIKGQGESLL